MNGLRRMFAVVTALSMFLLTACTLGTRPQLRLQIGLPSFQPSGPYVDDIVHLRAVDTLVRDWQEAHKVPITRPVLLWIGDLDGRTLSVVEVRLGTSSVTLQIDGEGAEAVVDRVVPTGPNALLYVIVGKRADRLLVSSNLGSVSVGAARLSFTRQLSQPISSTPCELLAVHVEPALLAYLPLYYLRTIDDRLARMWNMNPEAAQIDLCDLANRGKLPLQLKRVGSISIAPNLGYAFDVAYLELEGEAIMVTEFRWAWPLEEDVLTLRFQKRSGQSTWSAPDPGPRANGSPFILPVRQGGTDYLAVTWGVTSRHPGTVASMTGIERIAVDEAVELWRVVAPGATVTFTSGAGVTYTRKLPP